MMRPRYPCLLLLCAALACCLAPASTAAAPNTKIVGGSDATGPWPAVASVRVLGSGGFTLCGGTLISARWVLSAAHCFDGNPQSVVVRLGGRTLVDPAAVAHRTAGVSTFPTHVSGSFRDDLALIELAEASTAAPQPLVGPGDDPLSAPGTRATILGWGAITEGGRVSPTRPLQQAEIPIASDTACTTGYGSGFEPESMLCAGFPQGGVDTCQGDSGGPLLVGAAPAATRLAGVTSWGEGCARPGRPGVYVRLQNPAYQGWIRDRAPLDGFSVSPAILAAGERVRLTSTSSSPPGGPAITEQAWDLDGDGAFDDAVGATAFVTFAQVGQPRVGLRVTRAGGAVTTTRSAVVVGSGAPRPDRPGAAAPSEPVLTTATAPVSAPPASQAPAPAPAPALAPAPPAAAPARAPVTSQPAALRAVLRIRVSAPKGSKAQSFTLRCGPTGGSWTAPEAVCARLLAPQGSKELLRAPLRAPARASGPALAITGQIGGRQVVVRVFKRATGAGRKRYDAVRRLLGTAATDRAIRVASRR